MLMKGKLSPVGNRHLTPILSMSGYKPWCHSGTNAQTFTSKWESTVPGIKYPPTAKWENTVLQRHVLLKIFFTYNHIPRFHNICLKGLNRHKKIVVKIITKKV